MSKGIYVMYHRCDTIICGTITVTLNGTLHSKLALDFLAGLKVCIFWKIFTMKTISIDAVVT